MAAFRAKYPPTTPQIVGQIEEIRLDEKAREMYVADSYLGGRVMIYDLDTFAFKRGWGAYGKPLAQISVSDADRDTAERPDAQGLQRAPHAELRQRRPRMPPIATPTAST